MLRNEYQFKVLDALANNKALLSEYEVAHSEYILTQKQYQEVTQEYEKAKASHELDDFLYQELLKLNLQEGMHENLESKHSALIHVDYLQSTLAEAVQLLENESTGILDQLLKLRGLASGLEQKSSRFTTLQERFTSLFIEAEDLLAECKLQLENLETNPEELEKLQFKLDLLNRKMQKHKVNSVSDLIKIEKQLAERLKKTLNVSSQLDELKKT